DERSHVVRCGDLPRGVALAVYAEKARVLPGVRYRVYLNFDLRRTRKLCDVQTTGLIRGLPDQGNAFQFVALVLGGASFVSRSCCTGGYYKRDGDKPSVFKVPHDCTKLSLCDSSRVWHAKLN